MMQARVEPEPSFEELCTVLLRLTAAVSRARREKARIPLLDEIEEHAAEAISVARAIGERMHARPKSQVLPCAEERADGKSE